MAFEISSKLVPHSEARKFRPSGRAHRHVRIWLKGDAAELDKVESVQYELHPTFKDRNRVATNRAKDFEIKIWTWGYFGIHAWLRTRDGSSEEVEGYVRW